MGLRSTFSLEQSNIKSNKQCLRLGERTQVLVPQMGRSEMIKTRYTHSSDVATSSVMIASYISDNLGFDVDYQYAVENASWLHDIGQAPFGHDGQQAIDEVVKELGLEEGFDDNSNNLTVIDKNDILIRDYTLASVIKYPHKLYPYQKKKYQPILDEALLMDKEYYKKNGINLKNQKTTIACQIMDEADRNSYVTSDLADFICLGNTITLEQLRDLAKKVAHKNKFHLEYSELSNFNSMIKSGSKTTVKAYFNNLSNRFNCNYTLTENGIVIVDKDLFDFREFLYSLEWEFFILPKQNSKENQENIKKLKDYLNFVIQNNHFPSKTYRKKINAAKTEMERIRHIRDMVGENTDWYILNRATKEDKTTII